MKVSKLRILAWVAIVIVAVLGLVRGVHALSHSNFGNDLIWRRNEILCAHQGVNSFRIWNREITLKGFAPWWRPDFPNPIVEEGDKIVHAYPPWHTCFFYFYGWLPELLCISLMSFFFGVCTKFIVDDVLNISKTYSSYGYIIAGLVLSMVVYNFVSCFIALNYSILITALFLLLRKFINSDNQIYAGLCWALMMIKPQVGILFFWPLFWQKKYKTIIIAVFVCFCATCFTAFIVKENPITLILQIPEIGKPYTFAQPYFAERWLSLLVGNLASKIWMVFFFLLCALLSYWTKGVRDFLISSASITALIPYWAYSLMYDHIIFVTWFLSVALCAVSMKCWRAYWFATIFVVLFSFVLATLNDCHLFNFSNNKWIFTLIDSLYTILTIFASIEFAWQVYKREVPKNLIM